jgi:hypothetical protein
MNINIESIENIKEFVTGLIKTFRIVIVKWIFKNLDNPAGTSESLTFRKLILLERRALYKDEPTRREMVGEDSIDIPTDDNVILKNWFKDMIRVTATGENENWFWGDATIITAFRQMTNINVVVIQKQKVVVIQEQIFVVNSIMEGNICFDGIWLYRVNNNHYKIIFPYNVIPEYRGIEDQYTTDHKSFNISKQIYEKNKYETYQEIASSKKLANQMQLARTSNNAESEIEIEGGEINIQQIIYSVNHKTTTGGRNINMHFNNKKSKKPKKTKKRLFLNKKTKKRLFLNKNKTKVNKIVLTKKLIK